MSDPNQYQYQYQTHVNGTSSAGGTGGQQAGQTIAYQEGATIPSYETFLQTEPAPWAGGPPSGQLPHQQPQTYRNDGSGGPGTSG